MGGGEAEEEFFGGAGEAVLDVSNAVGVNVSNCRWIGVNIVQINSVEV